MCYPFKTYGYVPRCWYRGRDISAATIISHRIADGLRIAYASVAEEGEEHHDSDIWDALHRYEEMLDLVVTFIKTKAQSAIDNGVRHVLRNRVTEVKELWTQAGEEGRTTVT